MQAVTSQRTYTSRQGFQLFWMAAAVIVAAGTFSQDYLSYLCIALPVMVPMLLWLRAGSLGMPLLPIICGILFTYYAVPIMRHEIRSYDTDEIFQAASTVAAFIVAATLTSWPFYLRMPRRPPDYGRIFVSDHHFLLLMYGGIGGGIVYHVALISGALDWLGGFTGLVRAIVLTLASIACYLLGYARASRLLCGAEWMLALGGLLLLDILAWASLLLVGGLMYSAAALLGYIITAKRVPWLTLGITFAAVAVLQAGKYDIREKYWSAEGGSVTQLSVVEIPGMITDWVSTGLDKLWSDNDQETIDIFERASLLHMVLLVQHETPDFVPYLDGETYALLPSMALPRFVDEDKIISQAGLNLLSLRYGLQTPESVQSTTIGWGLVAEGYANFGLWGVIAVGGVLGVICGALTRLSAGASANSLPMFLAIAATVVLMDVEADFSYLMVTLGQAIFATLLSAGPLALARARRARSPRQAAGSRMLVGEISSAE
jgi:hypothetical protein